MSDQPMWHRHAASDRLVQVCPRHSLPPLNEKPERDTTNKEKCQPDAEKRDQASVVLARLAAPSGCPVSYW